MPTPSAEGFLTNMAKDCRRAFVIMEGIQLLTLPIFYFHDRYIYRTFAQGNGHRGDPLTLSAFPLVSLYVECNLVTLGLLVAGLLLFGLRYHYQQRWILAAYMGKVGLAMVWLITTISCVDFYVASSNGKTFLVCSSLILFGVLCWAHFRYIKTKVREYNILLKVDERVI